MLKETVPKRNDSSGAFLEVVLDIEGSSDKREMLARAVRSGRPATARGDSTFLPAGRDTFGPTKPSFSKIF
jgi:hypothetical protein